jgi:hypothetical protein
MGGVFVSICCATCRSRSHGYALRYFAQYPALALNWYPPGFYLVEAGLCDVRR